MPQGDLDRLTDRETWLAARVELLTREKELTRARDALSDARQALPLVEVEQDYRFETETGEKSLADLFGDKAQLIVYHFMFGPEWSDGCPSCSYLADHLDGIDSHLAARDTALVFASNAPLSRLQAYRQRMGWCFNWVSAKTLDFGRDFGVTFADEKARQGFGYNYGQQPYSDENPGLSVFVKLSDNRIAHSYSTYGRGLDILLGAYHLLDMTPKGRDEAALPFPMAWIRRHDSYGIDEK